jgi:DNA-binding transcriptional ArsR family regulator
MLNTFDVLADATRRRLLQELSTGEWSVGALVTRIDMSQPAVSKQLRVLREAGLARVRADGQRRMYSLDPNGLRPIDEWLQQLRNYWEQRVDVMEGVLTAMED